MIETSFLSKHVSNNISSIKRNKITLREKNVLPPNSVSYSFNNNPDGENRFPIHQTRKIFKKVENINNTVYWRNISSKKINRIFAIISIAWILTASSLLFVSLIGYTTSNQKTGYMCLSCPNKFYYDSSIQDCLPQKFNSNSCLSTIECRNDLGLSCQNGTCLCENKTLIWSNILNKCVVPATYTEPCDKSVNCDTTKSLICNNGSTNCSCPNKLASGQCDCVRELNNEFFWNGITCVSVYGFNETCSNYSTSYMCKTLTEGTICNGPTPFKCECPLLQYYRALTSKCEDQLTNNFSCSQNDACGSDLGLSCQVGICQCDGSIQFWTGSICKNYYTYNDGSCANDNQCNGNLICKTSGSCNCPIGVSNAYCDCPNRVSGNEYFWDASTSTCTVANGYNQTCSNALSSYMCKTLTEGTQCLGPSPFKCKCASLQYYNFQTKKCESQRTESETCTQADACRSDLGLSCPIGICECDATIQFWTGTICKDYYTYNDGSCANDNQCIGNLICKTSGSCKCPLSVSNAYCDCPNRVYGNEYYWNGATCVLAAVYGKSCIADYTCQYLTQGTECISGKCTCSSPSIWSLSKCVSCASGWYYAGGSCYKFSHTYPCYSAPASSLATLDNSDLYWLRQMESAGLLGASLGVDLVYGANCIIYGLATSNWESHDCTHYDQAGHHGLICGYVLV
jgi:hypothetical protein